MRTCYGTFEYFISYCIDEGFQMFFICYQRQTMMEPSDTIEWITNCWDDHYFFVSISDRDIKTDDKLEPAVLFSLTIKMWKNIIKTSSWNIWTVPYEMAIAHTSGLNKCRSTATSLLCERRSLGGCPGWVTPSKAASSASESPDPYPRSSTASPSPSHQDGVPELPDRVPPASASVSTSTEQLAQTSENISVLCN